MAQRINRPQIAGFLFFEAVLAANEVLVLPLQRSASRNGDNRISIQAAAGTKIAGTLAHPDELHAVIPSTQKYASTATGEYPALANCAAQHQWSADLTIAVAFDIVDYDRVVTALRITAPVGGGRVTIYGDY